jgi:hypothetical protein
VKTPVHCDATNESYFTVVKEDKLSAGEQLFNNNKLSKMWIACQFKIGDKNDWKLAFNHLFPPPWDTNKPKDTKLCSEQILPHVEGYM